MPRRNTIREIDKKMKREKDRGDKNEIGRERRTQRETDKETERERERLIEIYGKK